MNCLVSRVASLIATFLCAVILLPGCDSQPRQAEKAQNSSDMADTASSADDANGWNVTTGSTAITDATRTKLPDAIQQGKVEFRVGEGEEVFSFKPKDDGQACKFYDAQGNEICKFTFVDGKLKAKSPDDQPLFELKPKGDKLMIKDASGENELFKLKLKGDTIDFYQPGDVRVHRIKRQDYGWRLEDDQDHTLFRAKSKDGKMVLRDLEDQTVLYSKDIPTPLGLIFFRVQGLSREQQAACCVMFLDR